MKAVVVLFILMMSTASMAESLNCHRRIDRSLIQASRLYKLVITNNTALLVGDSGNLVLTFTHVENTRTGNWSKYSALSSTGLKKELSIEEGSRAYLTTTQGEVIVDSIAMKCF